MKYAPFESHSFDVVVCIRTIHALNNPEVLFGEVKRLLRPGGSLILEFANKRNLKQLFLNSLKLSKRNIADIQPTKLGDNILNFHPNYIFSYLRIYGFECKQIYGVSIFRSGFLKFLFPKIFLVWLDDKLQVFNGKYHLTPSIFLKADLIN